MNANGMKRPGAIPEAPAISGDSGRTNPTNRPDDDRLASVAGKEPLDPIDPLDRQLQARAVPADERGAETPSEDVRGDVAGERTGPNREDQQGDFRVPLPGRDAADDHRELARRDQTDRGRRLQERHQANQEIGVGAERLADLAHRVLEVRGLDRAAGIDRERGRGREPQHPDPVGQASPPQHDCGNGQPSDGHCDQVQCVLRGPGPRPSVGCQGSLADPRAGRNGVEHASTAPMISLSGTGP